MRFSRGMVAKSFEDVAFTMKPNDIAGPVESEFGYHIIKLTQIVPGKAKPLAEVQGELTKEIAKQRAGRKYAEAAEQFSNLVYEQSDTLKPVAEKFKLIVRDGGWITRSGGSKIAALNNPRLISAVFSDEVLRNKRNSEAIEFAQGSLISVRVVEHKPAAMRPLEEVQGEITNLVRQSEAAALAAQGQANRPRGLPLTDHAPYPSILELFPLTIHAGFTTALPS